MEQEEGVVGTSRIYVNGTLKSFKELFNKEAKMDTREKVGTLHWYKIKRPLYANSINAKTGKVVKSKILRIGRRKIEKEELTEVGLANGLKLVINSEQQLYTRRGYQNENRFHIKTYVGIPSVMLRHYDEDVLNPSMELVEFLAWQISEGCDGKETYTGNRKYSVDITQKDRSVLEHLKTLVVSIGDEYGLEMNSAPIKKETEHHRAPSLVLSSKDYHDYMIREGYDWGQLSAGKSFPDFIMQSNNEKIKLFLRCYMDAESYMFERDGVIQISTASFKVALQVYSLLKRFSINSKILYKNKCATNGKRIYRDYYEIHISGPSLRIYKDKIGYIVDYKKKALDKVCERKVNTNTEIIPMHPELSKFRQLTNISQKIITVPDNFNGRTNPSVSECQLIYERMNKLLNFPEDKICGRLGGRGKGIFMTPYRKRVVRQYMTFLKRELDKEVCYIPIKTLQTIEFEGWLYSVELEKNDNYVVEGMLVKSSKRQRD